MFKLYFFASFVALFTCEWISSTYKNDLNTSPFTYTIVLKDVDYTNGFELENGIKTRTPFK